MLYCSEFCSMIGVFITSCCAASAFVPHCFSLKCFAASCALLLWCMCSPCAFLLWNGVGLYFLFSSLIPIHLSLRSSSLETDCIILCFLSSLLLFENCLFSVMNSCRFLFFAASFLCSNISPEAFDSSNLLFLSFGFAFGREFVPFCSHVFIVWYLELLSVCSGGIVFHSS